VRRRQPRTQIDDDRQCVLCIAVDTGSLLKLKTMSTSVVLGDEQRRHAFDDRAALRVMRPG